MSDAAQHSSGHNGGQLTYPGGRKGPAVGCMTLQVLSVLEAQHSTALRYDVAFICSIKPFYHTVMNSLAPI
jgi:hypothetical protein